MLRTRTDTSIVVSHIVRLTLAVLLQILGQRLFIDLLLWTVVVFRHRHCFEFHQSNLVLGTADAIECHHISNGISQLSASNIVEMNRMVVVVVVFFFFLFAFGVSTQCTSGHFDCPVACVRARARSFLSLAAVVVVVCRRECVYTLEKESSRIE